MLPKLFVIYLFIAVIVSYALGRQLDVRTSSGVVRGNAVQVLNRTVKQFLGIPYAEPPIGGLRFAKPRPLTKPHQNVIDGTKTKNSCIQAKDDYMKYITTYSEDCLFVNVWSPDSMTTELKPVLFWIHGGGLTMGSSYQLEFNGSALATHDVVVASANYRLGPLGFLYSEDVSVPGNQGFYDQLLALKWIRDNIHLFGGDKDMITIFGESAGGWSVSAHLMSPLSKGLFKRAIISSGAHFHGKHRDYMSKEEALTNTKKIMERLNCTENDWLKCLRNASAEDLITNSDPDSQPVEGTEWLECLRKAKAEEIVNNVAAAPSRPVEGTEYLPLRAQEAFRQNKFNSGVVRDEGSGVTYMIDPTIQDTNVTEEDFLSFAMKVKSSLQSNISVDSIRDIYLSDTDLNDTEAIRWKIYDLAGDVLMKCPTYHMAKQYALHSKDKSKVFFYELTRAPVMPKSSPILPDEQTIEKLRVTHTVDNIYVFGFPYLIDGWEDKVDLEFTEQIMKYWTDFAKYGKPDADNWKPLITGSDSVSTLVRDLKPSTETEYFVDLFDKTCDGFWKDYYI